MFKISARRSDWRFLEKRWPACLWMMCVSGLSFLNKSYGQSAAASLAISNPGKAVDNADSHEYFGENTPSLN